MAQVVNLLQFVQLSGHSLQLLVLHLKLLLALLVEVPELLGVGIDCRVERGQLVEQLELVACELN